MSNNLAPPMTATEREASRAVARAAVYAILSQAFLPPTEAAVAAWSDGTAAARLTEAVALLSPGRLLSRATAAFVRDSRRVGADLARAHVRVFGYVNSLVCPPYETEYTAEHVFMKTDQMADVAGFYRAFGLEIGGASNERPDHVSAELEFMHVLALKEGLALRREEVQRAAAARRAQRLFLRDHLARWTPAFADRVRQEAAGQRFYMALATLLRTFVEQERARLRVRPRPLDQASQLQDPPSPMSCPYETTGRPVSQPVEVT